jgi:hypothetical protein
MNSLEFNTKTNLKIKLPSEVGQFLKATLKKA